MRLTRKNNSLDETTRRAQEQIFAARARAEKDLERATKQATRALSNSNNAMRQNPLMVGAIAGTAVVGGVAAWLLSRKRTGRLQKR